MSINSPYVDPPKQKPVDNVESNDSSVDGSDLEYNRSYGFYSSFREPMLLRRLNHCCIPKLQNVLRDDFIKNKESKDPYFGIVLPYKGKDAGFLQVSTQDHCLSLESIQQIFYRILGALNYLHSADIVHRDIKPTSIMAEFDRQGKQIISATLVSFGQARSLRKPWGKIEESKKQTQVQSSILGQWLYPSKSPKTETKTAKEVQGIGNLNQPLFPRLPERNYNLCYWAPELAILEEQRHVTHNFDWKKCDIWSLACCIAEMLRSGEPLFTAHTVNDLLVQIMGINECRPIEGNSFLDDKNFPIKSLSWPKEGKISLKESLSQIPTFVLKPKFTSPLLTSNSKKLVDQCVDILSKMLSFNADDRLTTGELLNHEFFADIKVPAVEMLCPPLKSDKLTDNYLVDFVIKYCGGPYTC